MDNLQANPGLGNDRVAKSGWINRALNCIEVVGSGMPDPAVLYLRRLPGNRSARLVAD